MEFWNSNLTEKSWNLLKELNKKYNFILIGGWAIYLFTKQLKSKDVDIVVEINELQKLKNESLIKNDRLRKYEIKQDEVDIDIYVSHYSKLAIPVQDLKEFTKSVEGFKVASPEALLVLKQTAELERGHSVKGEKDKIDIVSLLFFSGIDYKKYKTILKKYSILNYLDSLISLLRSFQDYNSLNLTPREFKLKKQEVIRKLRKL